MRPVATLSFTTITITPRSFALITKKSLISHLTLVLQSVGNGCFPSPISSLLALPRSPLKFSRNLSASITQSQRDEAVSRLDIYKSWFLSNIMELGHKRTYIIIPIENVSPRYRDEATTHFDPRGIPMLFLSPVLGVPETTFPIGQVPYKSKVSGRDEYLPVGVSLLGEAGSDVTMLRTVRSFLEQSGRPTSVKIGKTMF